MNIKKRLIDKIFKKIDSIAKKGNDGFLEYVSYVDDLIKSDDYVIFGIVMISKYDIDIDKYESIEDIKGKKVFNLIRLNTKSDFQTSLKKIYDSKNVYQMGYDIYSSLTNSILGQIIEKDLILKEYQYYKDQELIEKQDEIRNIKLEVVKNGILTTIDDITLPLIDKYKSALVILI